MQKRSIIWTAVLCAGLAVASAHASSVQTNDQATPIQPSGQPLILAGGNAALCKANYDQCIKGCAGMASCSNQCTTNYNKCIQ
jgi:hypothetical protein